ncbi:hypothetical protein AB0A76_03040 [Streptomyces exfoliatus]|uniref:Lipoprotein n=1 Tax=Streptomyces exfoliatus TaxID=1905 RepID=A0ABV3CRM0_STREX
MRPVRLRRPAALAVTTVCLALLVTACGGERRGAEPGGAAGQEKASASATSAPSTAKGLTQAELDEAIVAQADLKGHRVRADGGQIGSSAVIVDEEACKPIADALFAVPHYLATASARVDAIEVPKGTSTVSEDSLTKELAAPLTELTLSSYDGGNHEQVLAEVKASAAACSDGFTVSVVNETTKVRSVAPAQVSIGDESWAWTLDLGLLGGEHATSVVVFRKGSTVVTASTTTLSPSGTKGLPKALLDAQAAKLG